MIFLSIPAVAMRWPFGWKEMAVTGPWWQRILISGVEVVGFHMQTVPPEWPEVMTLL